MKQAMKKMGMKQTPITDVTEVIIRTKTNEIVITNADVVCVEMAGTRNYQISGNETTRSLGEEPSAPVATYSDDDVELVMSQAGCDRDKAIEALDATDGQPAEAIIRIISE
ncbi:MAG: Nascent polypeptide-associated complex protein [Candidatus Methanomethylophilaceae archaeon]|nr:Nascent polypeptide-associated complex protein [Candidatus Methanomethylophilaceae archaeon]